jgi:hypothetical protein
MREPLDPSSGDKARKPPRPGGREDRLKAALKANMARRKAQAKARHPDDVPGDSKKDKV